MILQVVFGTLLFVLFINIDEINAFQYNPVSPPSMWIKSSQERQDVGFRTLDDMVANPSKKAIGIKKPAGIVNREALAKDTDWLASWMKQ